MTHSKSSFFLSISSSPGQQKERGSSIKGVAAVLLNIHNNVASHIHPSLSNIVIRR